MTHPCNDIAYILYRWQNENRVYKQNVNQTFNEQWGAYYFKTVVCREKKFSVQGSAAIYSTCWQFCKININPKL